jgi:hypothetical protein
VVLLCETATSAQMIADMSILRAHTDANMKETHAKVV